MTDKEFAKQEAAKFFTMTDEIVFTEEMLARLIKQVVDSVKEEFSEWK